MNTIIAQTHSLPDSLYAAASDSLVATCEMRSKLSHFSLLNRRFAVFLKRCPVEAYLKTGGVYHELAGVEKRIDGHMELLRKDEFKETDCHEDLLKYVFLLHRSLLTLCPSDLDLSLIRFRCSPLQVCRPVRAPRGGLLRSDGPRPRRARARPGPRL